MKKGRLYNFIYGFCLVAFTAFAVLDTFIIPRRYSSVSDVQTSAEITASTAAPEVSDSVSSADGGVSVTVKTYRQYDTDIYVADVVLESAGSLKTALADSSYGRNIKEATSVTAQNVNAVLAVNGDFYGARSSGYVIRNGVLYMVFLFAVPLIYGLVPFLFSRTALSRRSPGAAPRRLYRWSAATLTVGCCFQGALEIYGTGSGLVKFYPIAAGALLMAAGAVSAAEAARRKRLENEE